MEILRFGPGFRRSAPPSGTQGLADQVIWGDARTRVTELAFSRRAAIAPRTSTDMGLFIVVSGGGWVQVGDERVAIRHGEAVTWPAGVVHGAWTDGSDMRAILVELPDEALESSHHRVAEGETSAASVGRGSLAERVLRPEDHDETEGEPW
jgi:quercetin dioxygenase-like cupin family protein